MRLFTNSIAKLQPSIPTVAAGSVLSLCRQLRDNNGSVVGAWRGLAAADTSPAATIWSISEDAEWRKISHSFQGQQVLVLSAAMRIAQLPVLDNDGNVGAMTPILKDLRHAILHITNQNSNSSSGGRRNGEPRLAIVAAEILALMGTTPLSPSQEVFGEAGEAAMIESIGSVSTSQINCMSLACAYAVARGSDDGEIQRLSSKIKGDMITFLVEHYPGTVAPDAVVGELSSSKTSVPMSVTHNISTFISMRDFLSNHIQQASPTRSAYANLDALRLIAGHLGNHPHLTVAPLILSTADDPSILLGNVTDPSRRREMLACFDDNPSFLISRGMLQDAAAIVSSSVLTTTSSHAQRNFEVFVESVGSVVTSPSSHTLNVPSKLTLTFECPDKPPVGDDKKGIKNLLVSLAPRCAFWGAVVDGGHFSAPVFTQSDKNHSLKVGGGALTVGVFDVMFPRQHLCFTKGCCISSSTEDGTTTTAPTVIYEDDDIMIVNKPRDLSVMTHLLSHSNSTDEKKEKCTGDLVSWLLSTRPSSQEVVQTGLVHRLDRGTSGVLVVAKNNDARSVLKAQFGSSKDDGEKKYIALCKVVGKASELSTSGVVEEDVEQSNQRQRDQHGSSSKKRASSYVVSTSYRILRHFSHQQIAVVEATISRGKKHQVRRHLQSVGLPLLGDVRYGGKYSAHPRFDTAALHAQQIAFKHPRTQERMVVSCDLPTSTKKVLAFWGQMERVFKRNLKQTTGKSGAAKSNFNKRH